MEPKTKAKGEKATTWPLGKKPRTPVLAVPAKGILDLVGVPEAAPKNKHNTCFPNIPHRSRGRD